MKNPVTDFICRLEAAYARKLTNETLEVYYQKLSRWILEPKDWDDALDSITANCDRFPTLAEIYPHLRAASAKTSLMRIIETTPIYQMFQVDGKTFVRKIKDPMNAPPIPENASHPSFAFPREMQAHEQDFKGENARVFFVQGWQQTNQDTEKANEIFSAIDRGKDVGKLFHVKQSKKDRR